MTVNTGIAVTREYHIRYCEDCRWYKNQLKNPSTGTCSHPFVDRKNLVMRHAEGSICSYERGQSGDCGREGRFWERRISIPVPTKLSWWRKLWA